MTRRIPAAILKGFSPELPQKLPRGHVGNKLGDVEFSKSAQVLGGYGAPPSPVLPFKSIYGITTP